MIKAKISHLRDIAGNGSGNKKTRCGKEIARLKPGAVVVDDPKTVTCGMCLNLINKVDKVTKVNKVNKTNKVTEVTEVSKKRKEGAAFAPENVKASGDISDRAKENTKTTGEAEAGKPGDNIPVPLPSSSTSILPGPMPEADKKRILYTAYAEIRGAQSEDEVEQAINAVISAVEGYYSSPKTRG